MGAAALPVGLIGSSVASGLLSPDPEALGSFSGDSAIDPARFLQQARSFLDMLLQQGITDAQTPVNLPTPDFSLPSFSGGSLPMPIGTTPKRQPLQFNSGARTAISGETAPQPDMNSLFDPQASATATTSPTSSLFGSGSGGQSLLPPRLDARTRSAASLLLQAAGGGA